MTKLLEQVLAEVRKLSDEEQDKIATELIAYLNAPRDDRDLQLSKNSWPRCAGGWPTQTPATWRSKRSRLASVACGHEHAISKVSQLPQADQEAAVFGGLET